MRWILRALAAAIVLAAGMGQSQTMAQPAPKRLALVIGNADYDGVPGIDTRDAAIAAAAEANFVPDLRNPQNDAADMRDVLTKLGFAVDFAVDKDRAEMSEVIASFGAKVAAAPDDAFVLIYYSGHAIQVDGANFLIPVRAKMPRERFGAMPSAQARTLLNGVAVSTGELLDQFTERGESGINILILDSCRNNPWERARYATTRGAGSRGLQGLTPNLSRTVVALSTAPGEVAQDGAGRNSPYTLALKDYVARPGLSVSTMFDRVGGEVERQTGGAQTPWYQSASIGEVCLAGCTQTASAVADNRPAPPMPTTPGAEFRDCPECPQMVVVPPGSFVMGAPQTEAGSDDSERPQRRVTIAGPLAVGKFEVTFAQWDVCVAARACAPEEEGPYRPDDRGWGRGDRPVMNVSWQDAKRYVRWLNSRLGGRAYRLLSEAEWEYVARAGTTTAFSTGAAIAPTQAQYDHTEAYAGSPVLAARPDRTAPVGSFPANAFKLHDLHGNVWEWVEDCYAPYAASASDGKPIVNEGCSDRVIRGGSWGSSPDSLRSAHRYRGTPAGRIYDLGFRVARTPF